MKSSSDGNPILVVDDDLVDLKFMQRFFTVYKHKHILAKNAKEGLSLYYKHRPEIIFLDMKLPEISGIELMEKILKDNPQTSIVIATGYGSIETAVKAIKKEAKVNFLGIKKENILMQEK